VEQPEGFSLTDNPNHIWKLKKALYGLKHAPQAWYSRLEIFLQDKGFKKGIVDNNLYIKSEGDNLLVVLVYVDDIIFSCTNESSVQWFANSMQTEFEMSMIREMSYFLGLQVLVTFLVRGTRVFKSTVAGEAPERSMGESIFRLKNQASGKNYSVSGLDPSIQADQWLVGNRR
jgi:hypothetical protein